MVPVYNLSYSHVNLTFNLLIKETNMKHRQNVKTMTIFAKKRAAKQGTRLRDSWATELHKRPVNLIERRDILLYVKHRHWCNK